MKKRTAAKFLRLMEITGEQLKNMYLNGAAYSASIGFANDTAIPTFVVPLRKNKVSQTAIWQAAKEMGFEITISGAPLGDYIRVYGQLGKRMAIVSYINKDEGD